VGPLSFLPLYVIRTGEFYREGVYLVSEESRREENAPTDGGTEFREKGLVYRGIVTGWVWPGFSSYRIS